MAINNNKNVAAFYNNGVSLVLNTNPNPMNTYAQIAGKTVINLKTEDLAGLTGLPNQQNNTNLKSVEVPNTILSAGSNTFSGCSNLESISFQEDSVFSSIASGGVFYGCSKLKEIIFPNSFTTCDTNNFWGCSSLSKIVFGTGIKNLSGDFLNTATGGNIKALIITKHCENVSDVPTISSSNINPGGMKIYLVDDTTKTSFSSVTNWSSNTSKIFLLNKIVINGTEHYVALPRTDTMTQALAKGYLADMENTDLTALYDFYTDNELITPFTMSSLVSDYVTSLGDGFIIYTKTKEVEE